MSDVPSQPESDSPLKQIRTYDGDIAEAVKGQHESIYSIRQKELARETNPLSGIEVPAVRKRSALVSILLFIFSLVLLAAGGAAAWYSYHAYLAKTAVPAAIVSPNRLIASEGTIDLNLSALGKSGLVQAIDAAKSNPLSAGSVEQLELHNGSAVDAPLTTTAEFLGIVAPGAPDALVRAFDPIFMLGLLGETSGAPHTFVLIRIDSFDNAFAGMFNWEGRLPADLLPLFADASSTAAVLDASTTPAFADTIIQNKDARLLSDPGGQAALVYSFLDQNTLIITADGNDLVRLTSLLTAEKLAQ